jgi:hypothetical protein
MTSTLTITKTIVDDHWEITGGLSAGSMPSEVFIYLNSGNTSIGEYSGVCNINELSKLQVFNNTIIPIFGNKFIRANTLYIKVPISANTTTLVNTIVNAVTNLSTAYKAQQVTTQIFQIP